MYMKKLEKYLKELTFNVWSGKSQETLDSKSEPIEWSFIFGIGSSGLSDFEIAIDALGLGEVFELDIEKSRLNSFFGGIFGGLGSRLVMPETEGLISMKFELKEIATPEPKEIVTAIAELQKSGGCGCGSDCGCGSH